MFKHGNTFSINPKYIFRQTWRGNSNGNSIKGNNFEQTIQTRYFRIYPEKTTSRFRCLRVEIYGCRSQGNRFPRNFYLENIVLPKNFPSGKRGCPRKMSPCSQTLADTYLSRGAVFKWLLPNENLTSHRLCSKISNQNVVITIL